MQPIDRKSLRRLRVSLLDWYRQNRRDFPWRKTTDPYKILIAEIMLQQTQVDRVRQKYPLFLKRFPDPTSLALAKRADALHAWAGMGYNNRAIRLREMARCILDKFDGKVPADINRLRELPGVGLYTSHAVACFSFGERVAVVDVNVRRVLSRLFRKMKSPGDLLSEPLIRNLAEAILPRDAYTWNQALMDLGSTLCVARKPLCPRCPVRQFCRSPHLARARSSSVVTTRRKEPSHAGIPNRLWRGKVIKRLRSLDDHRVISLPDLGKSLKKDFQHRELPWLMRLVQSLSEDGLLTILYRSKTPSVTLAE